MMEEHMPITEKTRAEARRLFEFEGIGKAAIARQLSVNVNTISNWARRYEWGEKGGAGGDAPEPIDDLVDEVVASYAAPPEPTSDAELRAEIIKLRSERDELAEKVDELNPTIDIREMLEDRVAWLTTNTPEGDRFWLNRAEAAFTKVNQQRIRDNLPPFDIKDEPGMLEKKIAELKAKEALVFDRETTEVASRKVKLAIMRNGVLTIEQIPLEGQINNTAGSLADGIFRYTRKGFKLTTPFLCPRAGCFRPAANDEFNKWRWGGYCTEKHYDEVEVDQDVDLTGVVVRDHGVLSGVN